ncbi:MAG: M20/M25/M40 family metallo-hydrolase, partial [Bacteroidota bacterium]
MKKLTLFLSFLISTAGLLLAQSDTDVMQDLQVDVVYLASDYLEGRATGERGEALAAAYMVKRFKEIGLTPKGTDGSWYQSFPFKELVNPHTTEGAREGTGKNVLAYLDNGAETTVIIGAHYDHLGMGGSGSRHTGEAAIHNGADDNASGVAAMFQIAEHLKTSGNAKGNNYLFIGFSGEEMGLFGSKYYVENPTVDLTKVNYMLN